MTLPVSRLERPKRVLHTNANFQWGKAEDVCPDFAIDARAADGKPVDVYVVCFKDPDGEEHVFAFSGEGKEKFLAAGRGGVVLANSIPADAAPS